MHKNFWPIAMVHFGFDIDFSALLKRRVDIYILHFTMHIPSIMVRRYTQALNVYNFQHFLVEFIFIKIKMYEAFEVLAEYSIWAKTTNVTLSCTV